MYRFHQMSYLMQSDTTHHDQEVDENMEILELDSFSMIMCIQTQHNKQESKTFLLLQKSRTRKHDCVFNDFQTQQPSMLIQMIPSQLSVNEQNYYLLVRTICFLHHPSTSQNIKSRKMFLLFKKLCTWETKIDIVLILSFFWFCCLIKFSLEYQRLRNVLHVHVHVHVHMCICICACNFGFPST